MLKCKNRKEIKNMSFITTCAESNCNLMEDIVDSQRKMTQCIEKGMSRTEAHDNAQHSIDEIYLE